MRSNRPRSSSGIVSSRRARTIRARLFPSSAPTKTSLGK